MINKQQIKTNIKDQLENLNMVIVGLNKFYDKCLPFLDKKSKTFEDHESIDSFVIKFARISDIYTQKILTGLVILSFEYFSGFIDKINICEKLNIINCADEMMEIRFTRNKISHEYVSEQVDEIFIQVMQQTPLSLKNINKTLQYINTI
jgi:hypothetical protein